MTWFEAKKFAQWIGGRLPSEAEWEYAARSGGKDIVYPWGNQEISCDRAQFDAIRSEGNEGFCWINGTLEACSKPLGNTAQGLCDMAGNVSEWVEDDWHDRYVDAPSEGQAWMDSPRSPARVLRGGSWLNKPDLCRTAARAGSGPFGRYPVIGFRVVRRL